MSLKTLALPLLALMLFVVGCTPAGSSAPAAAPTRAVLVTTQAGQSTILIPAGEKVAVMSEKDDATCPQCKASAAAYFSGGTLPAKCPACGATFHAMSGHQ